MGIVSGIAADLGVVSIFHLEMRTIRRCTATRVLSKRSPRMDSELRRKPPHRLRTAPCLLPLDERTRKAGIWLCTGTLALDECQGGFVGHGMIAN